MNGNIAYLLLAGFIGYRLGQRAPEKTPRPRPRPSLSDCGRPHLSEIPGLQRTTRSFPVIAQDQLIYRNIYQDYYDY